MQGFGIWTSILDFFSRDEKARKHCSILENKLHYKQKSTASKENLSTSHMRPKTSLIPL